MYYWDDISHESKVLCLDGHEKFGLEDGLGGVEGHVEPGDAGVG